MIRPAWILLLLLCACDPTYSVDGKVLFADGGAVADASVSLECEGGRLVVDSEQHTNARGEYDFDSVGCLHRSCRLVLDGKFSAPVTCTGTFFMCGRGCSLATVELRLPADLPSP